MPSSSPWAGWTWVGTPKANLEPHKTLAKFNQRMPKTAYDGRYVVTRVMAKFANHKQPLVLIGGGGGNRTLLSAIREPYADTRFSRVSLSKACGPTSYLRTLQYPGIPPLALGSGHYLVTEAFALEHDMTAPLYPPLTPRTHSGLRQGRRAPQPRIAGGPLR